MFPYNTDGVDFHGRNVHLHDLKVSNFDDVVAVKASDSVYSVNCTENVLVERVSAFIGVGLSIGSITPSKNMRCIRNVTFRDCDLQDPLKVIYVKSGTTSNKSAAEYGVVEDVLYENITAHGSLFPAIYLGPQQQKEPDGTGQGFFHDPTEPRVTFRNIAFRDVTVDGNLAHAGILRCNITNPCTGVELENVHIRGSALSDRGYICDDPGTVVGHTDGLSSPDPSPCVVGAADPDATEAVATAAAPSE